MTRHLLSILDLPPEQAMPLVLRAAQLKKNFGRSRALEGRTVILVFEKASTRTRVSFELAARHLGAETLFLTPNDCQLGRGEPIKDTARVLSRYADALVVRTFGQDVLDTLVEYGDIPIINALTDMYHPCQVLADVLTMFEVVPDLETVKATYIGDGNNMAHSFINAAALFPFELALACPEGYEPDMGILENAVELGARISLTTDPVEAVENANFIHTDVWASMGQEEEQKIREKAFAGYEVNAELLAKADPDCKVMHCLPAHRGEEISEEVFEGPASIVFDQAENRLHMQKAILEWIFDVTDAW